MTRTNPYESVQCSWYPSPGIGSDNDQHWTRNKIKIWFQYNLSSISLVNLPHLKMMLNIKKPLEEQQWSQITTLIKRLLHHVMILSTWHDIHIYKSEHKWVTQTTSGFTKIKIMTRNVINFELTIRISVTTEIHQVGLLRRLRCVSPGVNALKPRVRTI